MVERLLDRYPDSISLGEIHQIFSHWINFDKRQSCGCGAQFQSCPFWTDVLGRSIGGMKNFDPKAWSRRRAALVGDRHHCELLFGIGSRDYYEDLYAFADDIGKFYSAIADVGGAKVIVDSSKAPLWAILLQRVPWIEVRMLHFVRNPYATAYSWQRRKRMPEVWWEERYMPVYSAAEIGRRWRAAFLTTLAAGRTMARYMRIHYEDFVEDPNGQLDKIANFAGLPELDGSPIITDGKVRIEPGHAIMGNPMRIEESITIRPDDEWRTGLSAADRRAVRRYVWPLAPFYRS